jgi:FkbM family methyltransferase
MKHTKKRSLRKKSTRRNKRKHRGGSNIVDVVFPNDNNIVIKVDNRSKYHDILIGRINNFEHIFRKIINYMIQNNIINKDKNIIDLGAWIGDNTLPWAKNINGIVYGIDPSPNNCSFIKELITLNNIKNIEVLQEVISDKEEELSVGEGDIDHATFSSNKGTNTYKSKSLDSLYNQNIIKNVGFLHLDVEGMEYKIILGSPNLIEKENPIVSYEGHTNTDTYLNDIKKYFIEKNYCIYRIEEACGRDDCRNFLAIPNDINNNIKLEDIYSKLNIDDKIFVQVL